jgi:hypothetical protein
MVCVLTDTPVVEPTGSNLLIPKSAAGENV